LPLGQWLDDPQHATRFGPEAPLAALGAHAGFPLAFVDRSAFKVGDEAAWHFFVVWQRFFCSEHKFYLA
jgi:hypothetical protein